jgi:hypothetical protein
MGSVLTARVAVPGKQNSVGNQIDATIPSLISILPNYRSSEETLTAAPSFVSFGAAKFYICSRMVTNIVLKRESVGPLSMPPEAG